MSEKVRYISADLLRGFAIIVMIEVHVFNAFLLPELKLTSWFSVVNFINGLAAPSFLFVSGFAFQVSSGGKLDDMRRFGKAFWKKMARIFQIIVIGYALHLPYYSLSKIINKSSGQQLAGFFSVDVLQCIGAGLLFLFITRLLIKSDKFYHYFLIASLILVTAISPVLWKSDLTKYMHVVFANYFNRLNGSLFPVFPWLNFLLAGAIFANYFMSARKQDRELSFIKYSAITGIFLLVFGHIFYSGLLPDSLTSVIPNPVFFLERLGYVLFFLAICWLADRKTKIKNSFVIDASRESLLIYWLHLVVIYGMVWGGRSLASRIGPVFNIVEAVIATFILMLTMILIAKIWGWLKSKYSRQSTFMLRVVIIILLILFVAF